MFSLYSAYHRSTVSRRPLLFIHHNSFASLQFVIRLYSCMILYFDLMIFWNLISLILDEPSLFNIVVSFHSYGRPMRKHFLCFWNDICIILFIHHHTDNVLSKKLAAILLRPSVITKIMQQHNRSHIDANVIWFQYIVSCATEVFMFRIITSIVYSIFTWSPLDIMYMQESDTA